MDNVNWNINETKLEELLQNYIDDELSAMSVSGWEVEDEECREELQQFLLNEIIRVATSMQ